MHVPRRRPGSRRAQHFKFLRAFAPSCETNPQPRLCDDHSMDRKLILLPAAILAGFAGGYAWSVTTAPKRREAVAPKATTVAPPLSPEELPAAEDEGWAERSDDSPRAPDSSLGTSSRTADSSVRYSGCNEVRAAGKAPLYEGDPGYRPEMDGDGDGIACEPIRHP